MYNCFIILKHKFFAFFFLTKKKAKKPNLRKKKNERKKRHIPSICLFGNIIHSFLICDEDRI